jgi:hypothetical protein
VLVTDFYEETYIRTAYISIYNVNANVSIYHSLDRIKFSQKRQYMLNETNSVA